MDENILRPAIQAQLKRMGATTAENIEVTEKWYDVPLGLLIFPAVLGCTNWTIAGEGLVLEPR